MTAHVEEMFSAVCGGCHWVSHPSSHLTEAQDHADYHNRTWHPDPAGDPDDYIHDGRREGTL